MCTCTCSGVPNAKITADVTSEAFNLGRTALICESYTSNKFVSTRPGLMLCI